MIVRPSLVCQAKTRIDEDDSRCRWLSGMSCQPGSARGSQDARDIAGPARSCGWRMGTAGLRPWLLSS